MSNAMVHRPATWPAARHPRSRAAGRDVRLRRTRRRSRHSTAPPARSRLTAPPRDNELVAPKGLLLEGHSAAAAIRARVAAVVDVALAAVDITANVSVTHRGGCFHPRYLLAEAHRHLALVLRGRRPGLDAWNVDVATAAHRRVGHSPS